MKLQILTCIFACFCGLSIAQTKTFTEEEMRVMQEQMKKAQDIMNSPQYHQQMKQAMERMRQQGVDPGKINAMQKMTNPQVMQAGMGMSACIMNSLGTDGLNRVSTKAQRVDLEIKALCKQGKAQEANSMQKEYALKMLADPDIKAIQACTERYKDQLTDPSTIELSNQIDALNPDNLKDACNS